MSKGPKCLRCGAESAWIQGRVPDEAPTQPSLAERCFAAESAEEELFDTIHKILGGLPHDMYEHKEFIFPAVHTYVDPYDASVEVIMSIKVPPMNREQADAILALGFSCVYESQGSDGRQWTKGYVGKCSPRECKGEGSAVLAALRVKMADMEKRNA